jgi:hypothetical protein
MPFPRENRTLKLKLIYHKVRRKYAKFDDYIVNHGCVSKLTTAGRASGSQRNIERSKSTKAKELAFFTLLVPPTSHPRRLGHSASGSIIMLPGQSEVHVSDTIANYQKICTVGVFERFLIPVWLPPLWQWAN